MRVGKITEDDYKKQYKPCLECDDYALCLDAGTEAQFHECEVCGTRDVVLISDFESK